jgi:hypothetical protein
MTTRRIHKYFRCSLDHYEFLFIGKDPISFIGLGRDFVSW